MPTSAEVFSWREGKLLIWTGSANPVTALYLTQTDTRIMYGYQNNGPSMGGQYTDHLTGQRADVSVRAGYTYDQSLLLMMQSATAVHMEVYQSSVNGSAGLMLYSGRITNVAKNGADRGIYNYSLNYYSNNFSSYGGT